MRKEEKKARKSKEKTKGDEKERWRKREDGVGEKAGRRGRGEEG